MKKVVLLFVALFPLLVCAQDIIITINEEKIDAKVVTVAKDEIHYKKADYLDGPTFIISKQEVNSIIFGDGSVNIYNHTNANSVQSVNMKSVDTIIIATEEVYDETVYTAAEYRGNYLPKFTYEKVHVPGKKYKKWRYCGGNMVLTEREFGNFLQMHCKEAYDYYRKGSISLTVGCCLILVGFIPTLVCCIVSMCYSTQVLSVYNNYCASQNIAFDTNLMIGDHVQIAKIIPIENIEGLE